MSFFGEALGFVGSSLASGAIGYVGGEAAGWALSKMGLGSSDPNAEAIARLGNQLTGVQNSVNALNGKLDAIKAALEEKLREINQEQLYISWEVRDNVVQQYITQINTQFLRFTEYARNAATTTKGEVDELVQNILDTNVGAGISLAQLNTLVRGSGQDKGVLQLWTEMTTPVIQNGSISYPKAIEMYIDYYTTIAYAQIRAANLLVEAYNAQGNNPESHQQWLDYRNTMNSQEVPFLTNIDHLIKAGMSQGATWHVNGNYTGAQLDNFMGAQSLSSGAAMSAHYRPAPEHAAAESILANAQAMQPGERRLIVWMVMAGPILQGGPYSPGWGVSQIPMSVFNMFDTINLSLVGPNQAVVASTRVDTVHVSDDPNSVQKYRRFIYEGDTSAGFVDGAYTVQNENGQNGLIPAEGSNQSSVLFQSDGVLDYMMNVGPLKKADFMDFAMYADVATDAAWYVKPQ